MNPEPAFFLYANELALFPFWAVNVSNSFRTLRLVYDTREMGGICRVDQEVQISVDI